MSTQVAQGSQKLERQSFSGLWTDFTFNHLRIFFGGGGWGGFLQYTVIDEGTSCNTAKHYNAESA